MRIYTVSLLTSLYASMVMAENGIQAYQAGNYSLAAKTLENKDPSSEYYIGKLRLYGYGLLKNTPLALQYFNNAASRGYLPAEQLMARYMLVSKNDPAAALTWFKKAADQGDDQARMYCAAAYLFGFGTAKNPDLARRYYIDAARDGNTLAQFTLANYFLDSKDKNSKKLGLIWLSKAAAKGLPAAQNKLGELNVSGQLLPQNLAEAQALFQQAAKQGFITAMIRLGQLAQDEHNYPLAKDWLLKANAQPNAEAALAYGNFLLDKKTPFYNPQEGFQWIQKAAENEQQPSAEARLTLAKLYEEGIGITADPKLAQAWKSKAELKPASAKQTLVSWLSKGKTKKLSDTPYTLKGILTGWQNKDALKDDQYHLSPDLPKMTRAQLFQTQFKMLQPNDISIGEYYQHLASSLSSSSSIDRYPVYPLHPSIDLFVKYDSPVLRHDEEPTYIYPDAFYPSQESNEELLTLLSLEPPNREKRINFQNALLQLYNRAILGEADAQFELGQLYDTGIGVAKNLSQAITYYQLAATQQELKAEYNLGLLYLKGQTDPVDYSRGLDWLMDAAFKGNDYAQYALGEIYQHGLTASDGKILIEANPEQSSAMYSLAAVNHFAPAEYQLADTLVKQHAKNLNVQSQARYRTLIQKLYESAAEQGVAEAALPLAFYHAMNGNTSEQAAAFETAKSEAELGNSQAALLLGLLYDRGIGTLVNTNEALFWYEHALNNPITAFILGTYASQGIEGSQNEEKAKTLLNFAASQNLAFANYNLAILNHNHDAPFLSLLIKAKEEGLPQAGLLLADYYLNHPENPQSFSSALEIYNNFAEKGDKDAALKLAYLYDKGIGTNANPVLAEKWYLNAAMQNQPIAQYLLGHFYQTGRANNIANYAEAKKWYRKSAKANPNANIALGFLQDTVYENYPKAAEYYQKALETNQPLAQFNLGLIKEYGKGEPADPAAALKLYQAAATQGHVKAMTQLAGLYLHGLGTAEDKKEAYFWYQKAANAGERNALYQLGELTLKGIGTTADPQKAAEYFKKAMDLGQEQARAAYNQLNQTGAVAVPSTPTKEAKPLS